MINKKIAIFLCLILTGITINTYADNGKKNIYTSSAPAPIGTYSQAIQFGDLIYVSGQIPVDPKTGEIIEGNFPDQVNQVFLNIAEIAKAAGTDLDDTLKLTIYIADLTHFTEVNEAMKQYFHEPYPARAVIEIKSLPKHAPVEIEAVIGLKKN